VIEADFQRLPSFLAKVLGGEDPAAKDLPVPEHLRKGAKPAAPAAAAAPAPPAEAPATAEAEDQPQQMRLL
jgi:hypothetical protein